MSSPDIRPQKPQSHANPNDSLQLSPELHNPRSNMPFPNPTRQQSLANVYGAKNRDGLKHEGPIVRTRRNYSWPPALSVEAGMQIIPPLEQDDRTSFPQLSPSSRKDFDNLSTISSNVSSIYSSTKDKTAAQKAAGFRAAILNKWTHFVRKSEGLSKSFRDIHHIKSNKHGKIDKRGRPGRPDDNHNGKEARDLKDSHDELSELSGVIFSYMEQGLALDPKHGSVTNSPLELSEVKSASSSKFDRSTEPDRGRRVFSSAGTIQHAVGPQRQRKSRTASGKRHAWREPGREIYPVMEETDSRSEIALETIRHSKKPGMT